MEYAVTKTTVKGISTLSDGDIKASLVSEMVNGKCFQFIAPRHTRSGEGECIVWLEHA